MIKTNLRDFVFAIHLKVPVVQPGANRRPVQDQFTH